MKTFCERCKKQSSITIMSMFNKDTLCMECKEIERNHPDYSTACEAERAEIRQGNYNFMGIGKPSDL